MVLLIDDDKDDCEIFRDAANEISECKCHFVHSPADALSILNKAQKLPICIFLDINMPVMDGFAVLRQIRSNPKFSNIPVVMYSTTPNPNEAKKALAWGADRFIRKTSDYHRLVDLLKEVKTQLIDNRFDNRP